MSEIVRRRSVKDLLPNTWDVDESRDPIDCVVDVKDRYARFTFANDGEAPDFSEYYFSADNKCLLSRKVTPQAIAIESQMYTETSEGKSPISVSMDITDYATPDQAQTRITVSHPGKAQPSESPSLARAAERMRKIAEITYYGGILGHIALQKAAFEPLDNPSEKGSPVIWVGIGGNEDHITYDPRIISDHVEVRNEADWESRIKLHLVKKEDPARFIPGPQNLEEYILDIFPDTDKRVQTNLEKLELDEQGKVVRRKGTLVTARPQIDVRRFIATALLPTGNRRETPWRNAINETGFYRGFRVHTPDQGQDSLSVQLPERLAKTGATLPAQTEEGVIGLAWRTDKKK